MSNPDTATQPALVPASGATLRACDLLLRAAGGRSVLLRMPAPAVPDDPTEQLGLATPQFQDVPLAPVVFRKARATGTAGEAPRFELLVSATAVCAITASQAYGAANAVFAAAAGIVCDDEFFEILSATESQAFGQPYVFRLVLRAPLAQTT